MLLAKTGDLEERIALLENHIFELEKDSLKTVAFLDTDFEQDNEYIAAQVINNSVAFSHNYITINKGLNDSIKVGMGVVSHDGIVGEVRAVSNNFAVVQSLLNLDSKFSCMLRRSNGFGPILWTDRNPRFVTMNEYPSHESVAIGDTVVTSGHSDVFPKNIMVGVVQGFELQRDLNQYKLSIELSTDFNSLKNVLVVRREHLEEKRQLENKVRNAKN